MKKIMFNDRYGLTQAVIEGRKTTTRRIELDESEQNAISAGSFKIKDNFLIVWQNGQIIMSVPTRYKVGEIVAVAQSYENAGIDETETIPYHKFLIIAREHKGWRNKMYVSADLMLHRICITGVRCERLQDISDEECIREGVLDVTYFKFGTHPYELFALPGHEDEETFNTPRQAFASLIDRVAGKGTWQKNPWVVVYEFELVK